MWHSVTLMDIVAQSLARSLDPSRVFNGVLMAIEGRQCIAKCSISGLSQSWHVGCWAAAFFQCFRPAICVAELALTITPCQMAKQSNFHDQRSSRTNH